VNHYTSVNAKRVQKQQLNSNKRPVSDRPAITSFRQPNHSRKALLLQMFLKTKKPHNPWTFGIFPSRSTSPPLNVKFVAPSPTDTFPAADAAPAPAVVAKTWRKQQSHSDSCCPLLLLCRLSSSVVVAAVVAGVPPRPSSATAMVAAVAPPSAPHTRCRPSQVRPFLLFISRYCLSVCFGLLFFFVSFVRFVLCAQ
jgi:hypothetical protein